MTMTIRRRVRATLALAAATAMVAACAPGPGGKVNSADADGWSQQYAGTKLVLLAEATANSEILTKNVADFTKKTGITVDVETAPVDSLTQKAVLDFTTHRGSYDLISIPQDQLGSYAENKYIDPIDDWLKSPPAPTGNGFDTKDILPDLWKAASQWKGHYYGLPSNSAAMMMVYRKDLLGDAGEQAAFKAKYGYDLAPAKTWAQYRDIAEFFTRPQGQPAAGQPLARPLYGVTLAGKRHSATVYEWMNYAWGFGGDQFNAQGMPAINSDGNVKSLDYELGLTKFAPPGFTSATWDEITASIQQGQAAQSITWGDTTGAMEDPADSTVAGKMGYASMPSLDGAKPGAADLGAWTYTINSSGKNKEAAYLFMAWALSQNAQKAIGDGGGLPSLTSTFKDTSLQQKFPYWNQELLTLQEIKSRPRIPQQPAITDALGLALSQVLSGGSTPKAGLDGAQDQVTTILAGHLPVTDQ
jgi:multiple sugar transport system substrate-binding protein